MNNNLKKQVNARIKITDTYLDGALVIKISDALWEEGDMYACYLISGNTIVDSQMYRKGREFHFRVRKPGNYIARVYVYDHSDSTKTGKSFDLGFIFVLSQYYKSNKLTYINENLKEKGNAFVNESKIKFNGFPDYIYKNRNFWGDDPFSNRTWRWNLLQLSLLLQIISVHSANPKDEVLETGYSLLKDWATYAETCLSDREVWHDHGTALRLKNICTFFIYALKEQFINYEDQKFSFILSIIRIHISKLLTPSFYSKFTNHGFDQSLVLYQVCSELEYISDMDNSIELAAQRVIAEVDHAFCQDGGHKENSPEYLYYGIKQCLSALNIEQNYSDKISIFKSLETIIIKATRALCHTVKPDGFLPLVGDTSYFKVNNIFRTYKPKNYSEYQYVLTSGKVGTSPKDIFFVLPDTGYAFFRSHWNKENYSDAVYLSLKAGYLSRYHRHDDDLSITLYAYGEDWLVDGATYKHDNHDPHRDYIRSHLSHNLTVPCNVNIDRKQITNAKICDYSTTKEGDETLCNLHATTDMFENYFYSRKVEFRVPSELISIEDSISSNDDKATNYVSRLFFAKKKDVQCGRDFILVKGKKKTLKVRIISNENFSLNLVKLPQEKIIGWLSDVNFSLYQSNLVEVSFDKTRGSLNVRFALEFI